MKLDETERERFTATGGKKPESKSGRRKQVRSETVCSLKVEKKPFVFTRENIIFTRESKPILNRFQTNRR